MVQDSNFKLALKADTRPRGHKFFRELTQTKLNRACFSERIVPNWTFVRFSCVSADSINLFIWAGFRSKNSRNCLLLWSKLLLRNSADVQSAQVSARQTGLQASINPSSTNFYTWMCIIIYEANLLFQFSNVGLVMVRACPFNTGLAFQSNATQ